MLNKILSVILIAFATPSLAAENYATPQQAETLVKAVIQAIQTNKATTITEINAKDPKWVNGDLYPMIYDLQGNCLAQGNSIKHVGKNLLDLADADGKEFVRERINSAKTQTQFWQEYKYLDPVTKQVLPKKAYCEVNNAVIVCSGVYKR